MKRIAIALCLLLVLGGFLSAQGQTGNESNLFVKTIYVVRVYPHQLGYMVTYVGSELQLQRLFIPIEWFGAAAGKAEIVYGTDRAFPYVDIYWENGEFSHLRLYAQSSLSHITWGSISQTEDWSDEFDVDGLELRL